MAPVSAVVALHEHQFFKQGHVLLVFEQRAHQRRDGHFFVFGLQRRQRREDDRDHHEPVAEPAEELARRFGMAMIEAITESNTAVN